MNLTPALGLLQDIPYLEIPQGPKLWSLNLKQIWQSTEAELAWPLLQNSCSQERLSEAAKFKNPADQQRSWAAGYLLDYARRDLKSPHTQAFYSLSHSGPWVLCARHTELVGLDVESVEDFNWNMADCAEIMGEVLPKNRTQAVQDFLLFWTQREAWAKLTQTSLDQVLTRNYRPQIPTSTVQLKLEGALVSVSFPAAPGSRSWSLSETATWTNSWKRSRKGLESAP